MHPSVMATEGWVWARLAQRRLTGARSSGATPIEEADRIADLAQAIEALDRALRYADAVLEAVSGTALPAGADWVEVRRFVRRGRDALAHGDERLKAPGFGYSLKESGGIVEQFGKARRERKWRTDTMPLRDLQAAADSLADWLERESTIT